MNEDNKKVLAALHYHALGLSIIPVGANKKPLIEWKQYQNIIATVTEINAWWQQFPGANPAVVTGKISGIVVLDLDKKHDRTSKEFSLPATACAISGNGGEHFFFKYPNRPIGNGTAIDGEGVDFRGDGGYVLLDPSVNETGGAYQWSILIEDGLADMPEWLLKKMIPEESDKKWLSGKDGVSEGKRNDTAASMAGKIVSTTTPELLESLGWEQLKVWNNKNTPPLDEKELRSVFDSIVQKHPYQSNKKAPRNNMNGKAVTACFADIQPEAISWLWEGRIALGKLTMIAGDPGLGKSLLTATLATNVSKGYPFPVDGSCPPIGDVVLLSAEDDPADTIRPRLDAAGADCNRIHVLKTIQTTDSDGMPTERTFSLKRDVASLKELLVSLPDCCLVIIDPVSAYLDNADSNNNSDIRGLFTPLVELAAQHKIAIVLVSHLNKNSGGNALYRTMGSLAFTAAVRAAYIVTKDQHNPERRLLMPTKNNVAKDNTGLAYSVITAENGAPVIVWESEAVTITADEALALPESSEQHTATDDAIDFLADFLSNGSAKASDIQKEARGLGISIKCLNRARTKLGIKSKKSDFTGGWVWSLTEDILDAEDTPLKTEGILDEAGHLGNEQETLV